MPKTVDTFPARSWAASIRWDHLIESGEVWLFTDEEMAENKVNMDTLRTTAHQYAAKIEGVRFRTRYIPEEGLYVQAVGAKRPPSVDPTPTK